MATRVRIISSNVAVDDQPFPIDSVLELDDNQAEAFVKAGVADKSKEAVDYALSQGSELVSLVKKPSK